MKKTMLLFALISLILLGTATTAWAAESPVGLDRSRPIAPPSPSPSPSPSPEPEPRPDPRPQPVTVEGKVAKMTRENFALVTEAGREFQVWVGEDTRFRIPGIENPTYSDVREGDQAVVTGHLRVISSVVYPNQIDARLVTIRRPESVRVAGIVQRKSDAGFALVAPDGTLYAIFVGDETRYQIPGIPDPGYEHVQNGDQAVVVGLPRPDATSVSPRQIDAQLVIIRKPVAQVVGKVVDFLEGRRGFKLETGQGVVWSVEVDDNTEFRISGVEDPDLDDVRIGDRAAVTSEPTVTETPTILAKLVVIHRPLVDLAGEVTELLDDGFKLLTNQNVQWTILVDEDTRFRIPGVEDPELDDVQVGDKALVGGEASATETSDPEMLASLVVISHPMLHLRGEVTLVTLPDSFELETADEPRWTVLVDDDTEFRIPGIKDPSLENVDVGDKALVTGERPDPGSTTITAKLVVVQKPQPIKLTGTVVGIDVESGVFGLKLLSDEVKRIHTNPSTRWIIPGIKNPTISDLKVGAKAMAWVKTDEQGILTALRVHAQNPKPRPITLLGEIIGVSGDVFGLELRSGEAKRIYTDGDTKFHVPGVGNPTINDLPVGANAVVTALEDDEGKLWAQKVIVERPRPRLGRIIGEIIAIQDNEITVETEDGAATVRTDESTLFYIPGASDPGIGELAAGDMIIAVGEWVEDDVLLAKAIGLIPARLSDEV